VSGWAAELTVARRAVQAAVAVVATRPSRIDAKGTSANLVTDVDRRAEAAVRAVLERETPDIPILGEEDGGAAAGSDARWIVDPIDGTTNFVHGFPFYATSIALEVEGRSVVGIVVDHPRDKRFEAVLGGGATCDGARLAVSSAGSLAEALVATGFPYDRSVRVEALLRPVGAVLKACRGVRRAGAATLDLAYVAAGALDAFFESDLGPWDVAAGTLLVTEAGGRVTRHDGTAGAVGPVCSPLATNGRLHDAMVALLQSA
jgi:myo-inositol-1(or 4)-monophosphatase